MKSLSNIVSFFGSRKTQPEIPTHGSAADAPETTSLVSPEGGWEPAGFDSNGNYVVLSRKTGRLVTLRPENLNEKKLRAVLGSQFCDDRCSELDPDTKMAVFSADALTRSIRNECDALGEFDFKKVRGPGLYRDGDELVVHHGTSVRTASGEAVNVYPSQDAGAYEVGPRLGFGPDTACATAEDVKSLVETVQSFGLARRFDVVALLGWWATAFFGAVVPHRPILALTAERGSGKTTLVDLFATLLGPQAFRREGVPTVAQVLYELEHKSAALLTDEFEARGQKKKPVEDLLEMFRGAFSNGEGGRQTRVYGGKTRYYNAPSGVLLAGISLPAFDPATESRTVRVQLETLPATCRDDNPLLCSHQRHLVEDLGRRLRRLLVQRWPVMRDALAALRPLLAERGHEPRAADKLAPLLAGYVALTEGALPSREALEALVESCGLNDVQRERAPRDCEECLRVLLSRKVRIFRNRNGRLSSSPERVVEVVRSIANLGGDAEEREALSQQLQEFGLRIVMDKTTSAWQLAVCASQNHDGVRRMMQGTGWANGGWKDVLMRLSGAEYTSMRVAKVCERVVVMDLAPELFLTSDEDDCGLPALCKKAETDVVQANEVKGQWVE